LVNVRHNICDGSTSAFSSNRSKLEAEDFLPKAEDYLHHALESWILGDEPFVARLNPDAVTYNTYDQLMRLDEWLGREA